MEILLFRLQRLLESAGRTRRKPPEYGSPEPYRGDLDLFVRAAYDAAVRVFELGGSVMDAWRAARRTAQNKTYRIPGIPADMRELIGDEGFRKAARRFGHDPDSMKFGRFGWNAKEPEYVGRSHPWDAVSND